MKTEVEVPAVLGWITKHGQKPPPPEVDDAYRRLNYGCGSLKAVCDAKQATASRV